MPAVPGLEELWGTHAYACPFCHGHELSGRPIGILAGPAALHLVGLLAPIGSSVTVFTQGAELDAEQLAMLNRLGAVLRPEPVVDVSRFSDDRAASPRAIGHDQAPDVDEVSLDLGADTVTVAGLFVGTGRFVQSAPFAEQLGLDPLDSGCIAIDDFGRTSLPGVFAAGDLAHRSAFPMPMASVLNAAAAGQLAGVACVQQLLAAPVQK